MQRLTSLVIALATILAIAPSASSASPESGPVVAASPGPSPSADPGSASLAARLHSSSFTSDTTAAAMEALARSGIATYDAPEDTSPKLPVSGSFSPLQLLSFQAHSLALDAWGGQGLSGAQVDGLLPIPDRIHEESAPASAILAGYVAAVDTPGAAFARELMAGEDLTKPEQLHFPLIVLTLFVSDLAMSGSPRGALRMSGAAARVAGSRATATLCSDAASFIDQTISSLFEALKIAVPDNAVGAFVVSIWNWVVDQGQAFVHALIKAVTDAVLATIRFIAGGIAAVAEEVASLVPYVVTVQPSPGSPIALGPSPISGALVATVSGGDLPDWPDVMKDCASVAQVPLPSFRGRDEPVTWGAPTSDADGLVSGAADGTVTDGQGQARWLFTAQPDPGAAPGQERIAALSVPVTIHRSALDDARKKLNDALFGGIPQVLRGFVDEIFSPFLDPLQAAIASLIDTNGVGRATIVYHDAPPTPAPTVVETPQGSVPPTAAATRYFTSGTLQYSVSGPASAAGSVAVWPAASFARGSTVYIGSMPPAFGSASASIGISSGLAGGSVYVEDPDNPIELDGNPATCSGSLSQLDSEGAAGTVTCSGLSSNVGKGQDGSDDPNAYTFTVTFTAKF